MNSHTARDRLVYPAAVLLTLGLVSIPNNSGSATTGPRLTEFAAVQLQAEVTALVSGIADAAVTPPGPAASSVTGSGGAATCTYPCTIFDKLLASLPEDIRYALLPALYSVAWVIGLVMAPVVLVTSALFGWPVSLKPAAAADPGTAPETLPRPAEVTAPPGDRPSAPVDDAANSAVAVEIPTAGDDHGTGVTVRRDTRVATNTAVTIQAVRTPADAAGDTATVAVSPVAAPDVPVAAPDAPVGSPDAPVGSPDAPRTSDDAPAEAADLPAEDANAPADIADAPAVSADAPADIADMLGEATTTDAEPTPLAARSAEARTGSTEAEAEAQAENSDSSPTKSRGSTRSVR